MSKRILLVDEDPAVRSLLQEYLETHGHAVETAENGREALTKLDESGYDAVVTNYNMPEVNGLEVLHHARQRQPSIPVVMMTGESWSHLAAQALAALVAQACRLKAFAPRSWSRRSVETRGRAGK